MKRMTKFFALTIMLVSLAVSSFAQTASATAAATILTPITLAKNVDMNFGNMAVGSGGGTVLLTAAGVRSVASGDVAFLTGNTGTVAAAQFTASGTSSATYAITLPSGPATITDGAGHSMSVGTFTSSAATGTLSAATPGVNSFTVGATLTVGASQAAGSYSSANAGGSPFTVTVNYN